MTKFTVFNDIHAGAPYELYPMSTDFYSMIHPDTIGVSIGDVFDRKNVKTSELRALQVSLLLHQAQFAGHHLSGNHELVPVEQQPWLAINDVCFMHGDLLFWPRDKVDAFRAKLPGAGPLKRMFVQAIDELRLVAPAGFNDFFFSQCEKYLKLSGCHTIVCGHHHVKTRLDVQKPFGRVINLPRGINEVTA